MARECLPVVTADPDQVRLQGCVDTAVSILWAFTGRQFGCLPVRLRPCPQSPDRPLYWLPGFLWGTLAESDVWLWRTTLCGCGTRCRVGGPHIVHLPGPVAEVTAVTVGGEVMDPSGYVLEGDRLYTRLERWPDQDLRRPAGDEGTWTVDYLQGVPPPAGADQMVAILAREFWRACTGDKACRLPKRVESVSRQGISLKMFDPNALFTNSQTGIPEIDMWVQAVNPYHLAAPSAVSSPDYRPGGF